MFKNVLKYSLLLLFITSCTTSQFNLILESGSGEYKKSQVFDRPFDEVWKAAVTVMQKWPIITIEKESGILVTENIDMSNAYPPEYRTRWVPAKKTPKGAQVLASAPVQVDPGGVPLYSSAFVNEITFPTEISRCTIRVESLGQNSTQVTVNFISKIIYTRTDVLQNKMTIQTQHELQASGSDYYEAFYLYEIGKKLGIEASEPPKPTFNP